VAEIDKEVHESGATVANLRGNLRARGLTKEIAETEREIKSHDLEEAAASREKFEKQYAAAKEQETKLHTAVSNLYTVVLTTNCRHSVFPPRR
jgi:DNA repair protein RAD50